MDGLIAAIRFPVRLERADTLVEVIFDGRVEILERADVLRRTAVIAPMQNPDFDQADAGVVLRVVRTHFGDDIAGFDAIPDFHGRVDDVFKFVDPITLL